MTQNISKSDHHKSSQLKIPPINLLTSPPISNSYNWIFVFFPTAPTQMIIDFSSVARPTRQNSWLWLAVTHIAIFKQEPIGGKIVRQKAMKIEIARSGKIDELKRYGKKSNSIIHREHVAECVEELEEQRKRAFFPTRWLIDWLSVEI
jgi:hypothetical protein